jgi:hypothetical protein
MRLPAVGLVAVFEACPALSGLQSVVAILYRFGLTDEAGYVASAFRFDSDHY